MKLLLSLLSGIVCSVVLVAMWVINTVIVILEEFGRFLCSTHQ